MRPTEQGGVVLETREELALALNTLSASMLEVGAQVASTADRGSFNSLSYKVNAALDNETGTLDLNGDETGTLRDACKVAEANTHFSLGVLSCFQSMTGLPGRSAVEAAEKSVNPLIKTSALIAQSGPAATQLSGLLTLYGGEQASGL